MLKSPLSGPFPSVSLGRAAMVSFWCLFLKSFCFMRLCRFYMFAFAFGACRIAFARDRYCFFGVPHTCFFRRLLWRGVPNVNVSGQEDEEGRNHREVRHPLWCLPQKEDQEAWNLSACQVCLQLLWQGQFSEFYCISPECCLGSCFCKNSRRILEHACAVANASLPCRLAFKSKMPPLEESCISCSKNFWWY